jgi:Protein of unknown function (DUF3108)
MSMQPLGFSGSRQARRFVSTLVVLTASAFAAQAETWRAAYSVSLLGLPIGTAGAVGEFSKNAYRIDASAKLSGLATLVANSKGAASATGAIAGGHILPASYAVTAVNPTVTRTMRMSLASGAVTAVDISPPFEDKPDRIPVRDQDRRGVLDPVGAFVVSVPGVEPLVGPAACNRTIPVFDGYTRFDVQLAYVGQRKVAAIGYNGPVAVCSVRYVPIAGHRPNRPGTKFMAENKSIELWLAPVESARVLLPYRISARTMIGTTVIEASEFRVEAGK